MKKPARLNRIEARIVDDRLCAVLIGKDGAGRAIEIAIPEHGLQAVYADAIMRLDAYRAQEGRQQAGGYHSTLTTPGTPAKVGTMATTDGGIVVLTVRQGDPTELSLSYSPSDARALARELEKGADQADAEGAQPARH